VHGFPSRQKQRAWSHGRWTPEEAYLPQGTIMATHYINRVLQKQNQERGLLRPRRHGNNVQDKAGSHHIIVLC
jgi:hypothetical protein